MRRLTIKAACLLIAATAASSMTGWAQQTHREKPPRSFQEKSREADAAIRRFQREGRDLSPIRPLIEKLNPLRRAGRWNEAEKVFAEIMGALLQSAPPAGPETATAASRDHGLIAISEFDNGRQEQIFLISPDGSRRRQLTHEKNVTRVVFPSWSPSGKRLAYVVMRRRTGPDIYVINLDGKNRKLLAGGAGPQMTPAWSPDGRLIAYTNSESRWKPWKPTKIWIMNADGTRKRPLTTGPSKDMAPTWSPQGKRIAFFSNRDGGLFGIWAMDADGSNLRRLTEGFYDERLRANIEQKVPAWSPDGRHIAYWQGVEGTGPNADRRIPWEIWIMNAPDGSNQRRLDRGDDPVWSPDSRTILHPGCRNSSAAKPAECGGLAGWGIGTAGANRRIMFTTNGSWGRPSWSKRSLGP